MHKDYKIRKLVEADIVALIELNWQMYHSISADATYYGSLKHLMLELETPGSIFIGLFKDDVLVGFAKGYPFNKLKFTFSGLYVNMKYNKKDKSNFSTEKEGVTEQHPN